MTHPSRNRYVFPRYTFAKLDGPGIPADAQDRSVDPRVPRMPDPFPGVDVADFEARLDDDSGGMQPIFQPAHNAREAAKHLILLGDHLIHPARHCTDCIDKHCLTAEGLLEEAEAMGGESATYTPLARDVRRLHAKLLLDRVEPREAAAMANQVVRRLRKRVQRAGRQAFGDASPPAPASRLPLLPVLEGGEEILFFTVAPQGDTETVLRDAGAERWYRGTVIPPGFGPDETPPLEWEGRPYEVPSVPDKGYLAVTGESGDNRYSMFVPATRAVVIPRGHVTAPRSLGKATFRRYRSDGSEVEVQRGLSEDQAVMADLISLLMLAWAPDPCTLSGLPMPKDERQREACQAMGRKLAAAMVVNAWYESGLNPARVGDGGKSVGLFQLHESGMGSGMTEAQRRDPVASVRRVISKLRAASVWDPFRPLVSEDMAGGDTPVSAWTRAFCMGFERPANMEAQCSMRAKTAAEVFREAASPPPPVPPVARGARLPPNRRAQGGCDIRAFATDPSQIRAFRRTYPQHVSLLDSVIAAGPQGAWELLGDDSRDLWPLSVALIRARETGDLRVQYRLLRKMEVYSSCVGKQAHLDRIALERNPDLNVPSGSDGAKWFIFGALAAGVAGLVAASHTDPGGRR